jgi:tetraacyldisaccharide 4'-kinase
LPGHFIVWKHVTSYENIMRKLIQDILFEKRNEPSASLVRTGLGFLERGYRPVISIRNRLYDKGIFKTKNVACRVISIGNLTVGGTGKTPVVIMTAKMLKEAGYTVSVVSRGYRSRADTPLIVSDGSDVRVSPVEAGDEPHIIAHELPGIPVVVGKDRYRAAQLAIERFKPHIIILDDAFQHRRLFRNVDVVTIDAENPFGNQHLLPRGILREPPQTLKRAQAVILTRFRDELNRDEIVNTVRNFNRTVPVFLSRHVPAGLRKPGSRDRIEVGEMCGKKIAALSNIANSDSFYRTLESLGAEIVVKHSMPDHHRYTASELECIVNSARNEGAEVLVMTAKDECNLPETRDVELIDTLVLDIEAVMVDEKDTYIDIIAGK